MPRIRFRRFDSGLWASPPRDEIPENALAHAKGVHKFHQRSLRSRWGHQGLGVNVGGALGLFRFDGVRYVHVDDPTLDGKIIKVSETSPELSASFPLITGLQPAKRLTFLPASPQVDVEDQLFITADSPAHGGLFKIAKNGVVSKWGIDAPPDGFTVQKLDPLIKVIETWDNVDADFTNSVLGGDQDVFSQDAEIVQEGSASLRLDIAKGNDKRVEVAVKVLPADINLNDFNAGGPAVPSSTADFITFWLRVSDTDALGFLQLVLSPTTDILNFIDGPVLADRESFSKTIIVDEERLTDRDNFSLRLESIVKESGKTRSENRSIVLPPFGTQKIKEENNTWQKVRIPKSAFVRQGDLDWSIIRAVWFFVNAVDGKQLTVHIDHVTLEGGTGTEGDYLHQITFMDSSTGSRSNPNPTPVITEDVNRQRMLLSNIPQPQGPSIDIIEIWRSVGNGGTLFKAGEIDRNTAADPTQFTDDVSDLEALNIQPDTPGFGTLSVGTDGLTITLSDPNDGAAIQEGAEITSNETSRLVETKTSDTVLVLDREADDFGPQFTWKNPVTALQPIEIEFNNAVPSAEFFDAAGPHAGRVWWISSASTDQGKVFYSVSAKPESLDGFIELGKDDDPTQKLVIWNGQLFVFTAGAVYRIVNEDEPFLAIEAFGAPGTTRPYTVVATDQGIVYQAEDGVRIFNGTRSVLAGFEALQRLFQGETSRGIAAFEGVIATARKDEYVISDGLTILALKLETRTWREIGGVATALFYEEQTGETMAGLPADVVLLEKEGEQSDDGAAIEFVAETQSHRTDAQQEGIIQRLYIDANTQEQLLTPTLIVDNEEIPLPPFHTPDRMVREYAIKREGRVIGVRLEGSLTKTVEVFGIEADIYFPPEGTA